jgi:hypothetical protein
VSFIRFNAPAASSFSTSFPLTENPISQGGAWRTGLGTGLVWTDPQTDGAGAFGTMISFDTVNFIDSIGCLSGFSANHSVTATLRNNGAVTGLEAELLLRFDISANNARGYEVDLVFSSTQMHFVRWNGPKNSFTDISGGISTGVTMNDGDVWFASAVGNIITIKCNGTTVYTHDISGDTGSQWTDGNPGIGFWNETGSALNQPKMGWKNITAVSL